MRLYFTLSVVLLFSGCAQDSTQFNTEETQATQTSQTNTACKDAEYRQLDFWVWEWDLEWDQQDGSTGTGSNIITKTPYDDCVIT